MITPIKLYPSNNVAFKGTTDADSPFASFQFSPKTSKEAVLEAKSKADEVFETPKKSFGEKLAGVKNKFIGFLKGINDIKGVSNGIIRGVADGTIATVAIGTIGKNIKASEGQIVGTLASTAGDIGKGIVNTVKFIPSVITKAPIDNVNTILNLPAKFYTSYLKEYKGTAVLATLVGIGILALRVLQGKLHANKENAEIDHHVTQGGHKA